MKVIKKLGYRQQFNLNKIRVALIRTSKNIDQNFGNKEWSEIKPRIQNRLDPVMEGREEIFFWEVDDAVIDTLLRSRFNSLAREYIETRSKIAKDKLNDLGLSSLAMFLLKQRYLRKDANGEPIETAKEMMCRVGTAVANQEKTQELKEYYTEKFNDMLINRDFLPNSPCLVSAGTDRKGTWFACFAYSMTDSLANIFSILHKTAKTFQLGGGVGVSIANLREKGSPISGTGGESSGSVAFLELFNTMCKTVKAGGFRRGALMALTRYNHPDIDWFIHCKRDTTKLNNMNISVLVDNDFFKAVEDDTDVDLISPKNDELKGVIPARLMLESIATNIWETGEPGLLFYDRINLDNPTPHLGNIELTNPCLTGDTLLAVADGRNAISIEQLVKEGKDVSLYCQDMKAASNGKKKTVIKTGRNPRRTQQNVDVYKLTLDDDSNIKATGEHRVMLRNGSWRELQNLKPHDSLMPFNTKIDNGYVTINSNAHYWKRQFRMMWESENGKKQPDGFHLHHRDFNKLNDRSNNIQLVDADYHRKVIHNISGNKNPVYKLKKSGKFDEWKKTNSFYNNDGENNPMYGKHHSIKTRNKISKILSGRKYPDRNFSHTVDSKMKLRQSHLAISEQQAFDEGFDIKKDEKGNILIKKICPNCGKENYVPFIHRWTHVGFCNMNCSNKYYKTGNITPENVKKQISNSLKGRIPWNKGLTNNHKVKSVEYIGKEDVYNITVDDNHNFMVISDYRNDMSSTGICMANCSESTLLDGEACDLGSINLVRHLNCDKTDMDWDKLSETTKLATRFLDNMIDGSPFPDKQVKKAVLATRKIGIGVMGFHDILINLGIKYSSKEAITIADKVISFIEDAADQESKRLAKEKGTYIEWREEYPKRRNAIVTIQAPTGSISLIAGVSPGIEPNFYKSYSRELDGNIVKVQHPLADSKYFEIASEISPEQHLKILATFQKHIENSVSKTINVPEKTTVEEIKQLLIQAHKLNVKGVTIFRDNCSRTGLIKCEDCKLPSSETCQL